MNYLVFYKTEYSDYRVLYNHNKIYNTLDYLPDKKQYHTFEMFKGYEPDDDGLLQFLNDFNEWADELKENEILNIDYRKYYSHFFATEFTFKRLCKGKYESFGEISGLEAKWMRKCYNGGLMYCKKDIDRDFVKSFGYDYTSAYPVILGSFKFQIPTKEGKEYSLTSINLNKLKFGFYRCKVSGQSIKFNFSKDNVYTSTSLEYANSLDLNIELIIDDQPNAYLYDNVIRGNQIFGMWIEKLFKIKTLYPKNKLIKHLLSSLWGSLTRKNIIRKTYDEILEEKLDVSFNENNFYKRYYIDDIKYDSTGKEYYELLDNEKPYHYNIRLLPFLTAFCRNKIASFIDDDSDVIRIQTDNIVFNKPMKFDDPLFKSEAKTTGLIKWRNVNSYDRSSCST